MKSERASSVFLILISVVVMWSSYRLRLGSPASPGPGLLPFLAGAGLVIVSIVHFAREGIRAHGGRETTLKQLWVGPSWPKTVMISASLILYVLVLEKLGFLASTTLILIFLFRVVDPMRWPVATGAGLAASFASYAIFAAWLQVQLPRGVIERLLF